VRRLAVFGEPDLPLTYLRTIQDARWIHQHLRPGVGVIIVGAGVIGLEIASSVLKVGGNATVIESGPNVMGRNVTPWVAQRLLELHREHGVAFHFNVQVDSVSPLASGLRVKLDSGVELEGDFAVVGVGVQPNDQLALTAGAEVNDGIIVDAQGRCSIENMWAVGDVARVPMMGQLVRQETWRHADSHPRTVAAALLGGDDAYEDVPGFWTEQLGRRFQVEGQIHGEEIIRDGIDDNGGFATLYVEDGKLLGASAIDNPKITALARRVIASGQNVDSNVLRDPNIDLKRALRRSNLK
jgi:3-phenylpropionate/trans-cinnamate dioxygenase ferredoxin reductase subunit